MSFSKRTENALICYTRPLNSLKNQNDHFFWVDASIFPLVIPWHNDKTLRKDPHPTPAEFNTDVCNYLADNPAPFRKFLKPFLFFVGISRYYDLDENCSPTFWAIDDEGAGNDDVNEEGNDNAEANQTEQGDHVVHVGGIDIVADDEAQAIIADKPKRIRKERKAADGASGLGFPPKKLKEDHGTSGIGASTSGKSIAALQSLLEGSTLAVEVGVEAVATIPFITSSVTLTPERDGPADFVSGTGLRTQQLVKRFVISSYYSHDSNANDADDEVTSIVRSSMPPPPVFTAAVATTTIVGATSALIYESGTGHAQASIFRDSASPSTAEANVAGPSQPAGVEVSTDTFLFLKTRTLRHCISMDYEQLFVEFNVGATRYTCLGAEVRMPLEHEIRGRKRFEEAEATEAIRLRGQVVVVEAAKAARHSFKSAHLGSKAQALGIFQIEAMHMHKAHKKRRALLFRALSLGALRKGGGF
ncbi:hypothetical protein Tco_1426626 [Tanacetum coccineum]